LREEIANVLPPDYGYEQHYLTDAAIRVTRQNKSRQRYRLHQSIVVTVIIEASSFSAFDYRYNNRRFLLSDPNSVDLLLVFVKETVKKHAKKVARAILWKRIKNTIAVIFFIFYIYMLLAW